MAQRKITTGGIANDAITTDLLGDNLELQGNYVKVPVGDTASRPSGEAGVMRFNTDTNSMEQYDGTAWVSIAKPPIISSLSYPGSQTAVSPDGGETITISGTNFTTGVNVKFGTTYATSVTRTNSTSLSVVVPALTAGIYDVIVENGDGMQATLSDGIEYNAAPVFTTASGSLGSIAIDQTISTITIVATEEDSGAITYAVTTGSLPTGLTLSGADIGGAPTGYSAETTVNFTITATDDEGQTTDRAFSLTVLVDFLSYEVDYSARFTDDISGTAHLSRTPSSAGNRNTWTWSGWVRLGETGDFYGLFGSGTSGSDWTGVYFNNNSIYFNTEIGGSSVGQVYTTKLFRDVSAWYHVVIRFDNTEADSADRIRIYVNGDLQSLTTNTAISSTSNEHYINSNISTMMGAIPRGSATFPLQGYLAEIHFVDGQSLAPTSFGVAKKEVWLPRVYNGTYGTNGFYLDFGTNVANDQSGNSNNFTANNMNTTNDFQIADSPTNVFAIMNYNYRNGDIRRAGLEAGANDNRGIFASMAVPPNSGSWYWELVPNNNGSSTTNWQFGICEVFRFNVSDDVPNSGNFYNNQYYLDGRIYKEGSNIASSTSWGAGDVLGIRLDTTNNVMYFYVNDSAKGPYNTQPGVMYAPQVTAGAVKPAFYLNFGQDSSFSNTKTRQSFTDQNGYGNFYYGPGSAKALCTRNLSSSQTFELDTGEQPADHFDVVTWTGDGVSGRAIDGLNFSPDLVWIKARNIADSHHVFDTIRGATNRLMTDSNAAEGLGGNTLLSFTSDGFTVSDNGAVNGNTNTYVAWCWKAGGTASSNTDGSITSNVSANTTSGFSIVTWTGNGVDNSSIGHGLNSAPEMIITKKRNEADSWNTWHKHLTSGSEIFLDTTAGETDDVNNASWGDNHPGSVGSSTFEVGYAGDMNASGKTMIAYCFHSVDGFSKIDNYKGNSSSDGPFVFTGFRPRFILIRRRSGDPWIMHDTERSSNNGIRDWLEANSNGAEQTYTGDLIDVYSNGFKIRYSGGAWNSSGETYLYMAFAEAPEKYGNAR